MSMDRGAAKALIASSEWFRELPPEVVERLVKLARLRRLQDGERLFSQGDEADGLYGVMSGRIRISSTGADGRELLVQLFEPGAWFGEISMFDDLPRTHDGAAQGPAAVLVIPKADFRALLEREPGLYPHFLRMLCRKLRRSFGYIESAAFLPLRGRIAYRLTELAQLHGREADDGAIEIGLHLPQEELARMVASTRPSVSRELKALEAEGVLDIAYGKVRVLDAKRLEKMAEPA
ncbi:Crp/Fnr family transcriptional regulator [uncultured Abyssibacter sp.]|uniref:Crp/Fnr family transcriptional regulator n=1 Tax=uncultured Abyssibacter sp. TaxID=2320202 RepID=UPI0032B120E3